MDKFKIELRLISLRSAFRLLLIQIDFLLGIKEDCCLHKLYTVNSVNHNQWRDNKINSYINEANTIDSVIKHYENMLSDMVG